MAEEAYVLDDYATLNVEESDGNTSVPIAGVQGVTIVPNVSIERLYTADSIKIEEQQQFEFQVDVSIEYALWDDSATLVKQWLDGSGGSTGTSISDTTNPQKFKVIGAFNSVNGNTQLTADVTGITFEEMPVIDTEQGEFVSRDVSGVGEGIENVDAVLP
jgi:hypothetical protein